jgi:hypothetical protein
MSISAADRVELHELAARYCDILDAFDWPSLTSVFMSDATFDFRDIGLKVAEGVEAIRDQLVAFGGRAVVAHLIANVWVADGEPVRLHSKVLTILPDQRVGWGTYVDDVVRTPDGWRVQRRAFTRGARKASSACGDARGDDGETGFRDDRGVAAGRREEVNK